MIITNDIIIIIKLNQANKINYNFRRSQKWMRIRISIMNLQKR